MSKKDNILLQRLKKLDTYKAALSRAPEEDRDRIEKSVREFSNQFSTIIDKLFYIAQDPKLSAKLKEELLRIDKSPVTRKEEVTENGES